MSKTAAGLIEHCKGKLGTPYVYGAKGEILTQAILDRLARENPGTYTSAYKAKAAKYIGRRCTDCSGLISWYTGRIRGSYNYHDTAVERVGIDHLDESMAGWALWKPGHIGVYIGGGYCIEAKGINYGTIKSRVTATPWQKVLKLCDIDYTPAAATYAQASSRPQTVRDGGISLAMAVTPATAGTGSWRPQTVPAGGTCSMLRDTCSPDTRGTRREKLPALPGERFR